MRLIRVVVTGSWLLGLALGGLSVTGGCSSGDSGTGEQVKVDQKQQEDVQSRMREFMAKKKAGGKAAKK